MPVSDVLINRLKQKVELAEANRLATDIWKWAYQELRGKADTWVVVALSDGSYAAATAAMLGDLDLKGLPELDGTLGEMSLLKKLPVVAKSAPTTRQVTDLLDEDPNRPVLIMDGDRIEALVVGRWDTFVGRDGKRRLRDGAEFFLELDAITTVADALQEAQRQGLPHDRPIVFRRPDGTVGHLFPVHLAGTWQQLIDNATNLPIGKIPVGPSFIADRFGEGAEAERIAEDKPDARGVVVVLEEGRIAGVVLKSVHLSADQQSFFWNSDLGKLFGSSPSEHADPQRNIAKDRPPITCPHCTQQAKSAYDFERDRFVCAKCGKLLGKASKEE